MLRLHFEGGVPSTLITAWEATSWTCVAAALIATQQGRLALESRLVVHVLQLIRHLRQHPDQASAHVEPCAVTLILGVTQQANLTSAELADLIESHGLL